MKFYKYQVTVTLFSTEPRDFLSPEEMYYDDDEGIARFGAQQFVGGEVTPKEMAEALIADGSLSPRDFDLDEAGNILGPHHDDEDEDEDDG